MVQDKATLRQRDLVRLARSWLESDFTLVGREWAYKNIRRALYAEQLLLGRSAHGRRPITSCSCSAARCASSRSITIDSAAIPRFSTTSAGIPLTEPSPPRRAGRSRTRLHWNRCSKPLRPLSAGVDFVRVDLYEIDGKPYFGELTNSPNKGLSPFRPLSLDLDLGAYFQLDDYSQATPLHYETGEARHNTGAATWLRHVLRTCLHAPLVTLTSIRESTEHEDARLPASRSRNAPPEAAATRRGRRVVSEKVRRRARWSGRDSSALTRPLLVRAHIMMRLTKGESR